MFKAITRFLSNMFEGGIALIFLISLIFYFGMMLMLFLAALTNAGMDDNPGVAIVSAISGGIALTFFEMVFLIMLGASAVMVDIRNELVAMNRRLVVQEVQ